MALADARVSVTPGLFEPTEDPLASGLPPAWELEFWVPGRPQTAGSKRGFVNPRTGRAIVTDDFKGDTGAKKKAWRSDLRDKAEGAVFDVEQPVGRWPADGPLEVEFVFVLARPKSHYRTGANAELLRDTAPFAPATMPDALKLARSAEDALTGIVWVDDSRIVREVLEKQYPDRMGLSRGVEGCRVRVRRAVP